MALIEFCSRLIDTKLEYSITLALEYAQKALEKELREQKKEEKDKIFIH